MNLNQQHIHNSLLVLCLLTILASQGCSPFDFDGQKDKKMFGGMGESGESLLDKLTRRKSDSEKSRPSTSKKIRWDGDGVVLGEIDGAVFSTESFRDTVEQLAQEKRLSNIRNLVKKYPDVALSVLQEANPVAQDSDALQLIAKEFDGLWCQNGGVESTAWQSYLVDLRSRGRNHQSLLDLKNQFWEHLKQNEPEKSLSLKIVNRLPRETDVAVSAEFYRLEAIALMMNDQFDDAIKRLQQSLELVESHSPYQAARRRLLLGEFYRHNGQLQQWKAAWANAVNAQSKLLSRNNLQDPAFWSRAAYLRPAKTDWPADALNNLRGFASSREIVLPTDMKSDSIVWMTIGLQHNDRAEGQNAVLAFKKAEAASGDRAMSEQLQLFQARSMVLAGQPGAASAILIRLISRHENKPLADRAQAILGAMKLQNGAIGQGINLIEASMKTVEHWPRSERLRAQADYGLALLVNGNETEGLALLDQVQSEFASAGQFDDLHQVLWNKAKYFEKTEQAQRLASAKSDLSNFEQTY